MQIKVLKVNTSQVNKGKNSYNVAEVAYKNVEDGKVASKKLLDFVHKDVYQKFASATPDTVYNVKSEKDANGYWVWVSAEPVEGTITDNTKPEKKKVGDWETSEERKARQVYIVRQSSLERAIDLLQFNKTGTKGAAITVPEVLVIAKQFEAYVFGDTFKDQITSAMANITDMEDDVPQ
jgi:hypothetical protein